MLGVGGILSKGRGKKVFSHLPVVPSDKRDRQGARATPGFLVGIFLVASLFLAVFFGSLVILSSAHFSWAANMASIYRQPRPWRTATRASESGGSFSRSGGSFSRSGGEKRIHRFDHIPRWIGGIFAGHAVRNMETPPSQELLLRAPAYSSTAVRVTVLVSLFWYRTAPWPWAALSGAFGEMRGGAAPFQVLPFVSFSFSCLGSLSFSTEPGSRQGESGIFRSSRKKLSVAPPCAARFQPVQWAQPAQWTPGR